VNPPTGTITLLFLNINGIIKLWNDKPGGMGPVFARLDSSFGTCLRVER
jgi:hypothetical protein